MGFGFLIYDANLDVEEADQNNPEKWDADFEGQDLIVIRLGAEVSDGPIGGRLDVYLLGEWGMGVSLVIKI